MSVTLASRRETLIGAGIAAASAFATSNSASAATEVGGIHAIPELAPQWKELDLAEILSLEHYFVCS